MKTTRKTLRRPSHAAAQSTEIRGHAPLTAYDERLLTSVAIALYGDMSARAALEKGDRELHDLLRSTMQERYWEILAFIERGIEILQKTLEAFDDDGNV